MIETLPEFLLHWAERTPDAIFLGEPDRGRTYAYGQVAGCVARARALFRSRGVARGDRIAILADNSCAWVSAYLGVIAHGAVAVPLNTRHAAGDLDQVLGDVAPAAIVGDPAYLVRVPERYRRRLIASPDVEALGATAPARDGSEARPEELGVVCYTSGTTGANIFANINRQGHLGADAGKLDIFVGAAQRIAELNGVADAPHIRDKITQLIKLQALVWSTGVAASTHARVVEPGVAVPDPVYANTGKHVAMEGHYLATRLLLEIAGGSVETLPSVEDQRAPELEPYFDKYYAGATGTAAERIRLFRFIRDLTASDYAGWWDVEIIHGSGSPAAEWLQMYREYDLGAAVRLVERLATG